MSATPTAVDSDDPFAGYGPQPVRCRWLSEDDAAHAPSAEVIRLVVDDQRGHSEAWANDRYQAHFLREVSKFIGLSNAVVMTDAGCIKARIADHPATMAGLAAGLEQLNAALGKCATGEHEVLLGLDGCIHGRTTNFQTVVHIRGRTPLSLDNTAVKLYRTEVEESSLIGWRLCKASQGVPDQIKAARRATTAAGTVLVLVCNDASLFKGYWRREITDPLKLAVRSHLRDAMNAPLDYVLIATHWVSGRPGGSGVSFQKAAESLADETGATVITTLRAPTTELEQAAHRFKVIGPKRDKVATLLVFDTLESN